MKKTALIVCASTISIVLFLFVSCEDPAAVELATFNTPGDIQVAYGQVTPISFTIPNNIKKVELLYNDSIVKTYAGKSGKQIYKLEAWHLGVGSRNLALRSYYEDGTTQESAIILRVVSDIKPKLLKVEVLNLYPHNTESYTQGLEFSDGVLYEGTGDPGQQGKTILARVKLETGEILAKKGLDASYFGEGITIMGDQIYQITWQSGKCFLYDKKDLSMKLKDFTYTGEGWGLCNDGKQLIMSDGSETIFFRNPKTFQVERTIEVYDNTGPIVKLNELEYIDGKIYANVYGTNFIVAIDPATGKVLETIDATNLDKIKNPGGEVLNGIAYNPTGKKWYMTGKYWDKLFEVKLVP